AGTNSGSLLTFPARQPEEATVHQIPSGAYIKSIRFCDDGSRISLVDGENNQVFVLAVPTYRQILHLPSQSEVHRAELNQDGSRVAVTRGRDLLVYDVDTGRSVATSERHHAEQIRDLFFLPGDQSILSIG